MRLLGYTDRLSVAPGESIRFMVSCDHPTYDARLVRLIHGDTNPAGPGFKQEVVPSAIDGSKPGKHEEIRSGSYVQFPLSGVTLERAVTFFAFVQPTNPDAGEQTIASLGNPYAGAGWALAVSDEATLELVLGAGDSSQPVRVSAGPLRRWEWYAVALTVDRKMGTATVWRQPVRPWPGDETPPASISLDGGIGAPSDAPLVLAGILDADGRTSRHLDGRIDRPRLFSRLLNVAELAGLAAAPDDLDGLGADVVGAWDFSRDPDSDVAKDVSGNGRDGRLVNMPARAVTGHNFSGKETCFRLAPEEYGAIHFHRDDLEDAGWGVDFELEIPADLPSGVYAAWLRAGSDEDYLPFIVRPPRGSAGSKIAVLMSTMTYVCYSNFTDVGVGAWREGATGSWALAAPYADPTLFRDVYRYIDEHALYGLYDRHLDGSGVMYGSYLKPVLTMRPKFRYRVMATPPRFPADLYLVDWLQAKGFEADFITDHDLNAEGPELLRGYNVVISSSHHEYWTGGMLDSLETYLDEGGRFMYLSGNGLYGVVSVDPARPHKMELRRWGTSWPFEVHPAERYHSMTGEPGGTWRNRGRTPNRIVGVGMAGAGFEDGVPFKRMPDSHDPRVAFIFAGIGDEELIGDHPSLQVRWGAAGYEFDRYEAELGSPQTTLLLASSIGFKTQYANPTIDEELWFAPGRDGARVSDPQRAGEPHRFVRADITYTDYPRGGAVFAAGSICWRGGLSWNGYDNTVSRVTENVLRRFAQDRGTPPSAGRT